MKHTLQFMATIFFVVYALELSAQGPFNGYALYNKQNNSNAYLIDADGEIAHTWLCDLDANYAMALRDNGNIVRGAVNNGNVINGAAVGGRVQEIDPNGNVVWNFTYSNSEHVSHHDICLMPNGNVLLIAWEVKSESELLQHGSDDPEDKYATHIVEVQQDGNGGEIVWEWHVWDHMIQDHDSSKDNYGVVAEHPELMDVNLQTGGGGPGGGGPGGGGASDWFHVNGIDYNPSLDQIVFSSRFLNEIFIIDHSTTTEEAAGHSGGNAGMGGDFLYRWGHPSNYGAPGPQVIPAATHDARWILEGRPNAGFIQIVNNEGDNGHTTIDAINPPLNGYNYDLTAGQAYAPASYDWRHECLDDADGQSASDRMSNGNIFVALSQEYMYEVDTLGNVVWQYAGGGPQKAFRYECDHPGLGALLGADPCGLVGIEETETANISFSPNPSNGIFNINGLPVDETASSITIYDMIGKEVFVIASKKQIDLTAKDNGFYFVMVDFENGERITKKICLSK
jgi:hypothetical protein